MFRNVPQQDHQDQRTLQAFTSLLTLVEALGTITEQGEHAVEKASPITLATAAKSFADIALQVLDCTYVGVIALDPPNERQRLLGTSGLSPAETEIFYKDTYQTPLAEYVNAEAIARLHADQVVTLDLKRQPFMTSRSTHGARYRLVAPMMKQGRLIGLFTMAKTEDGYLDVQNAYTQEERALAKGIARLATQVIDRATLLQEQAQTKANEQKLQEAARRYEDCLSTASHELRTPLTTIKGNLQLSQRRIMGLAKKIALSPEMSEGLQRAEQPLKEALNNFSRLERMISELLDYSRIQAEKFLLRKQPCDLAEIAHATLEVVRKTMPERSFLLTLPPDEHARIDADQDRIGNVIHNYLTNAHKYSPLARPITVSLTIEEPLVRLAVRDEGTGIPPEELGRVWERFYRVPGIAIVEQSADDSNLGLGLYLCQEIIEHHHGHVGVESTPGQGSTFWFTLPLAPSEKTA